MKDFKSEVKSMSASDIKLILDDQLDLYTEEEILILREELSSRPPDAIEKEEELQQISYQKELELQEKRENERIKRIEKQELQRKFEKLKQAGYDGYWEYKVISINDNNSGSVDINELSCLLNELGQDGWHLKCAYSNEIGKNSFKGGYGGISAGTNSTIEQNVLIFEKFNKFYQ